MVIGLHIVIGLCLLVVSIALFSSYNVNRRNYTLKKGTHGPKGDYAFHTGITSTTIKALFDKTCMYKKMDVDDYDLNKLWGFSYGHHHKNSVRVGWRPSDWATDMIEIWLYTYIDGERKVEMIKEVFTNQWYRYDLAWSKDTIRVMVTDSNGASEFGIIEAPRPKTKWGYYLFLYYGGNKTAPHDMQIRVLR